MTIPIGVLIFWAIISAIAYTAIRRHQRKWNAELQAHRDATKQAFIDLRWRLVELMRARCTDVACLECGGLTRPTAPLEVYHLPYCPGVIRTRQILEIFAEVMRGKGELK